MKQKDIKNQRIAVVGIGGVGGYLASMLARVCPHLTVVARGERKEYLEKNGLSMHSDYNGEIHVQPETVVSAEELEEQDYIFVCVKNYSLEEVCAQISHAVTENTVIIPVMNGVDPGERIRSLLGIGTVVDSLIYIVAFLNHDFTIIQQGNYAYLRIGIKDADSLQQEKVDEVSDILEAAHIDFRATREIETEIWRKYIFNCAYNVASAYYDNTIGELRNDPQKAREYEELVREAYRVALKKGVRVTDDHIESIIHRFYHELADEATSSLQRDIRSGKRAEIDTFSGYIIREGKKWNVDMTVSEKMYEKLRIFEQK